jgi:chromatin structure-remodeling complex subunit RSC1/2
MAPYDPGQRLAPSPARSSIAAVPSPAGYSQTNAYNPPRPIEVYTLDTATNTAIPQEIRDQFQRDEFGRVLFFTQPPLSRAHCGLSHESASLGHSLRYLADRSRHAEDRRAKRKARDELRKEEEKKRFELEDAQRQQENKEFIELASNVLVKWAGTMNQENEELRNRYDGWTVKDDEIDAIGRY